MGDVRCAVSARRVLSRKGNRRRHDELGRVGDRWARVGAMERKKLATPDACDGVHNYDQEDARSDPPLGL